MVKQGGVLTDGTKVEDGAMEVELAGEFVLQAGKRRFALVVFVG